MSSAYSIRDKAVNQGGFTLVESLVAITILIIGVLGPMSVATRGITDGLYAQNQLIATHLAQEGLELLSLQVESNNVANDGSGDADNDGDVDPDDFLFGLGACLPASCAVVVYSSGDSVDFSFSSCASASNCDIVFTLDLIDPTIGFYKPYVSGNQVKFRRTLTVTSLTPVEVLLQSTVTWTNKVNPQSITLHRYAFDRNQ